MKADFSWLCHILNYTKQCLHNAHIHLATNDVGVGHADNRQKPEHMQHLQYAQQHVVSVVDRSHPDNGCCLKQRASQNSTSQE